MNHKFIFEMNLEPESSKITLGRIGSSEVALDYILGTQNTNTQISTVYCAIYRVMCFKVQIKPIFRNLSANTSTGTKE